jgi:hypothetical protein
LNSKEFDAEGKLKDSKQQEVVEQLGNKLATVLAKLMTE